MINYHRYFGQNTIILNKLKLDVRESGYQNAVRCTEKATEKEEEVKVIKCYSEQQVTFLQEMQQVLKSWICYCDTLNSSLERTSNLQDSSYW